LPEMDSGAMRIRQQGRELDLIVKEGGTELIESLRRRGPEALTTESLSLEEIFVAVLQPSEAR